MTQKTITINGTIYDAHTGLPVDSSKSVSSPDSTFSKPRSRGAHDVHATPQKSHTLNRKFVKKSAPKQAQAPALKRAQAAHSLHKPIQKSPAITKFAPHPKGTVAPARGRVMSDIGPTQHPVMQNTQKRMLQRNKAATVVAPNQQQSHPAIAPVQPAVKAAPKPSAVIKQEALAEALEKAPSHQAAAHKQHKEKAPKRKSTRFLSIASASLALLMLGGYFTYLNMPNLSVRVAAAQAGIDASYPSYRPDGYSLNGPVAYNQGEVSMKFAANTGGQNFSIVQSKTDWDSSALKENYAKQKWGENMYQYTENGLTIFTHDGDAAWVNNGILYIIDGDAPLSSSQIRGIATSM